MSKQGYVYMLASKKGGVIYTGVTSNLKNRIWQHKNNQVDGFTKLYGVHTLVWYEIFDSIIDAITKEKTIKNWKRDWKIKRIEESNSDWVDLYEGLF